MPFDPYALCPGGRDKKIRFCCPNMLKEIEQVERLLESEQSGACLAFIESLEKNHPNCACLTTAKLSIYRTENRWQEALPIAERFHADEPDNPTAAAEYALALVVSGNHQLAISMLVDGFECSKADAIHTTLLRCALQAGSYLLIGGLAVPAIAIGNVLKEIPAIAESANKLLYHATADAETPLLLRDWAFEYNCPDDFPGKTAFEEATVLVRLMRWKQALALLEPLTQHADVWSGIWRNIAAIHFWLLDNEKGCEALKIYASLPNTHAEDAVDAETVRFIFVPDPLGDQTDELMLDYTLTDDDKVLESLLSNPLFRSIDTPGTPFTPPPRGCFQILDRPFADSETALTLETVSSHQAVALLFGKETDREARLLVIGMPVFVQETIETLLRSTLGDLVQFPGKVLNQRPVSMTQYMAECRLSLPQKSASIEPKTVKKVFADYYDKFFVETWLALPLGLLDGKTPVEAATESKYSVSLMAAIQMLEAWIPDEMRGNVVASLLARLGLPAPDTITVTESTEEDPLASLDAYPVWRWHRFDVRKLSTEILSGGLQIVLGMRETRAAVRFAEELLCRPIDSMPFPARVMAFEALIAASHGKGDIEQALLWVERAKNESATQGVADAAWCFHEITLQLAQGNHDAVEPIIRYLVTKYRNDSAVMDALHELFIRIGLLNPDGTLPTASAQAQSRQQTEEPKIWTPDGSTSAGSAAPPKLWVPD